MEWKMDWNVEWNDVTLNQHNIDVQTYMSKQQFVNYNCYVKFNNFLLTSSHSTVCLTPYIAKALRVNCRRICENMHNSHIHFFNFEVS